MKGKTIQSSLTTLAGLPGPLPGREFAVGVTVTVLVALFLAWGFVPGSETVVCEVFAKFSIPTAHCKWLAFPLMALLFSLSSADLPPKSVHTDFVQIGRISVIPILVAILYSAFTPERPMLLELNDPQGLHYFVWFAFSVPIGEELIFRRWLFSWLLTWFRDKNWPDTNPLPVVIWLSALGFSLWHLQNLDQQSTTSVLFQVGYTFVAGVWLGYLRWLTGRLWPCLLGHMLINAVC